MADFLAKLRRPMGRVTATTASLLVMSACSGDYPREPPWEGDSDPNAVVATNASVVHVDDAGNGLIVIRPGSGETIEVERIELTADEDLDDPRNAPVRSLRATLDGTAVLAVTVSYSGGDGPSAQLHHWVDGVGAKAAAHDLPADYGSMRLTPDHRRVILFHGDDSERQSSGLHNANQFSVFDLDGSVMAPPATVDGFGGRLQDVHFPGQSVPGQASPIEIGGVARDLAVFLAEGEIILYDLDDPDASQVAVQMPADHNFRPEQTLMRAGDDAFTRPVLFVRSSASADVAMLTLVGKAEGESEGFSVQVSLLTVGTGGTDMMTVNDGDTAYLATLRGNTLVFSDISTQQNRELALDWSAEHLDIRRVEDAASEAILWGQGGEAVMIVPLEDIEGATPRRVEKMRIQGGIDQFVRLGPDQAMVSSPPNLYILDFRGDRSVTPISADVDYDADDALFGGGNLHIVPQNNQTLYSINLKTLAPSALSLDERVRFSFAFPDLGKLLLMHPGHGGYVTVVDAKNPSRDTSYSRWGYLLEDILDQDLLGDEDDKDEEEEG